MRQFFRNLCLVFVWIEERKELKRTLNCFPSVYQELREKLIPHDNDIFISLFIAYTILSFRFSSCFIYPFSLNLGKSQ